MPKSVMFEGQTYTFPDDATNEEISKTLQAASKPAVNPNAPNPITSAMQQSTREVNQRFADQQRGFQYAPSASPPQTSNMMMAPGGLYIGNPRVEQPEDTLAGYGRTLTYALSPYATGAALGAAAGAPFGGVTAIPGAVFGAGSVMLSDLGSSLYNAVAPQFGAKPIGYASDVIRNAFTAAAPALVGPPETAGQRQLYSIVNTAAQSATGAGAAKQLATNMAPGLTRNVLSVMGGGTPAANLIAGGAAGAAGQTARELNAPPWAQFLAELGGGVLGSYGTAGVNAMRRGGVPAIRPSQEQLTENIKREVNVRFEDMERAGVRYSKESVRDLIDNLSSPSSLRAMGLATEPTGFKSFMAAVKGRLSTGERDVIGPRGLLELRRAAEGEASRKDAGDLALVAKQFRIAIDDLLANDAASLNAQRANVSQVLNQLDEKMAELPSLQPNSAAVAAKQTEIDQLQSQFENLVDTWGRTDPAMRRVYQAYEAAQTRHNRVFRSASSASERAKAVSNLDTAYNDLLAEARNVAPPSATALASARSAVAEQNAMRREAVSAVKRSERGREIDEQLNRIANDVSGGTDPRKAIQSGLKRLLNTPSFKEFATPEQKQLVERALQGDLSENVLAAIGSFSPGGSGWRSMLSNLGIGAGLASSAVNPLFPIAALATPVVTMGSRAAANVAAENKINLLAESLKTGAAQPKPPSTRPGRAALVGTTAAVAAPKETEPERVERELAKPKTKLDIIAAPANDKEVQRMLRVANDILNDADFGKKYTLPEIVKLYNVLYDAGEAGYSDVIPFADELANYYDQRADFENRVKKLGPAK